VATTNLLDIVLLQAYPWSIHEKGNCTHECRPDAVRAYLSALFQDTDVESYHGHMEASWKLLDLYNHRDYAHCCKLTVSEVSNFVILSFHAPSIGDQALATKKPAMNRQNSTPPQLVPDLRPANLEDLADLPRGVASTTTHMAPAFPACN
jgi:hypothetical protein